MVFLFIIFLKLFVYSHANVCVKSGGVWYENVCLTEKTSSKQLEQMGLILEEKTDKTNIKVTYPYQVIEYPEIFEFLKKKVETIKKDNGFEDQDIELGMSGYPWSLNIDMSNYVSGENAASILGYVFSFTGGAHPNHSYFSVKFDKNSQDMIKFTDLFDKTDTALNEISSYVIAEIKKQKSERLNEKISDDEWLVEGAGPDLKNYSIFVFVIDGKSKIEGLKFIYPPYQVGPYVEGEYEVTVPSAIFYNNLRSSYKDMFKLKETK
jgi:hypothetical protein